MKSHRDLAGIVLNVVIAFAILALIILGLNRMGLYKLPRQIENLFSPADEEKTTVNVDDSKIYNSMEYDADKENHAEKVSVTFENARTMLENVRMADNFYFETATASFHDGKSVKNKITLTNKDGNISAEIFTVNGVLAKSIESTGGEISVKIYDTNGKPKEFKYPEGGFTVTELAGVVLSHENFLKADYELKDGEFSVIQGDFGIELEIVFNSTMENYVQREEYRINLDYGIITSAKCYEADELVYLMQTLVLREHK